jgi:hypothetical protein
MLAKPKMALVGLPSDVLIDSGSAKNARYASEFPSIRKSSRGASPFPCAMGLNVSSRTPDERRGAASRSLCWRRGFPARARPDAKPCANRVSPEALRRAPTSQQPRSPLHDRHALPEDRDNPTTTLEPAARPLRGTRLLRRRPPRRPSPRTHPHSTSRAPPRRLRRSRRRPSTCRQPPPRPRRWAKRPAPRSPAATTSRHPRRRPRLPPRRRPLRMTRRRRGRPAEAASPRRPRSRRSAGRARPPPRRRPPSQRRPPPRRPAPVAETPATETPAPVAETPAAEAPAPPPRRPPRHRDSRPGRRDSGRHGRSRGRPLFSARARRRDSDPGRRRGGRPRAGSHRRADAGPAAPARAP